jgi:uncharacterized protein YdaU (DUF1376 family)
MAALPYMQLYVAEYLADTCHLNAAQHGAYLLLLMNYWQRGKPLPDLNDRLAIVARMSNEEWTANREVIAEFFQIEDGMWIHDRVERDLEKVKGISDAGRTAGLASAEARRQRAFNDRSTDVPTELQRDGNQQNRTEQIKTKKDTEVLRVYEVYPHKVGKGAAVKEIEKAFVLLRKRNEPDPEKFLVERISGWIEKRERDRAAGKFIPEYPNPSTWFHQERYDDEDNLPKPKKEWHVLTDDEAAAQWEKDFALMGRANA